jgi:hypothetical protein
MPITDQFWQYAKEAIVSASSANLCWSGSLSITTARPRPALHKGAAVFRF